MSNHQQDNNQKDSKNSTSIQTGNEYANYVRIRDNIADPQLRMRFAKAMEQMSIDRPRWFLKNFSDDPKPNMETEQEVNDIYTLMKYGRITGPDQYYQQKEEQKEQEEQKQKNND